MPSATSPEGLDHPPPACLRPVGAPKAALGPPRKPAYARGGPLSISVKASPPRSRSTSRPEPTKPAPPPPPPHPLVRGYSGRCVIPDPQIHRVCNCTLISHRGHRKASLFLRGLCDLCERILFPDLVSPLARAAILGEEPGQHRHVGRLQRGDVVPRADREHQP